MSAQPLFSSCLRERGPRSVRTGGFAGAWLGAWLLFFATGAAGSPQSVGPPPSAPAEVPASAVPASAAAEVSAARLRAYVADLESFVTRYASTAAGEAAGLRILEHFERVGLQAAVEPFTFGTVPRYTTHNIIGTLPGRVDPSRVVIVSAHYDSYSDGRPAIAPGADDNASGTAAVMEAATVLAQHAFDFTVRFIAFGAEEWGLVGSQAHALAARQRNERIVAVVNLDMIGYADRLPEDLDIVSDSSSAWLADRLARAAGTQGLASVMQTRTSFGSDCTPFWQQGYASVCGIEDNPLRNPYYHRTTDTSDTLDFDLVTAITRATVMAAAELAQPVSTPAAPAGLTASAQTARSLLMRARIVSVQWGAVAGASGYNVYRASTTHGAYQKLNTDLVRGTSFANVIPLTEDAFYVVTAVDGQSRESNYSGEAVVARVAEAR